MRWQMSRRSENIEDRRGMGPVGMGRGVRVGGAGGLGLIAFAVIAMLFGVNPMVILGSLTDGGYSGPEVTSSPGARRPPPGPSPSGRWLREPC